MDAHLPSGNKWRCTEHNTTTHVRGQYVIIIRARVSLTVFTGPNIHPDGRKTRSAAAASRERTLGGHFCGGGGASFLPPARLLCRPVRVGSTCLTPRRRRTGFRNLFHFFFYSVIPFTRKTENTEEKKNPPKLHETATKLRSRPLEP